MNDILESLETNPLKIRIVKRLPRKKDPNTIYVKLDKYNTVATSYIYISNKWHKLDDYTMGIFCKNGDVYLGTL